MTTELLKRLFTVQEYHRMIEAEILHEGDRVELIRGEIIQMAAIGSKHAAGVNRLNSLLYAKFGAQVIVAVQNPIETDEHSEPQPDIAVLQPRPDFYAAEHPKSENVFLLVEVSDTTLRYDRSVKIPLYAESGIAEVWILDLNAETIEVYREPTPSGYQSVQILGREQAIALVAFPEVTITVDEILG